MRALIGLLVLGALFVMAATWQGRTTEHLRDKRAQRYGIPSDSVRGPEGWSELVLGRPSGAEPLPLPEEPVVSGDEVEVHPSPVEVAPRYMPDFEYEVKPNEVLGLICQRHYGTSKPKIVSAVAEYNDLRSPDSIRAGDVLLLPDKALLLPDE